MLKIAKIIAVSAHIALAVAAFPAIAHAAEGDNANAASTNAVSASVVSKSVTRNDISNIAPNAALSGFDIANVASANNNDYAERHANDYRHNELTDAPKGSESREKLDFYPSRKDKIDAETLSGRSAVNHARENTNELSSRTAPNDSFYTEEKAVSYSVKF